MPHHPPGEEGFFLKHANIKGGHLLADEKFNITGIIKWQLARIAAACEAFVPSIIKADLKR